MKTNTLLLSAGHMEKCQQKGPLYIGSLSANANVIWKSESEETGSL